MMDKPQILWVAQTATLPDAGFKSHTHPYYHMFCVTKGVCTFVIEDESCMVQPGQCLLVPKKVSHAYTNTTGQTAEYLEIKFSLPPSALDTQLLRLGAQVTEHPLAAMLVREMVREYSELGSIADNAAVSYLTSVLHVFEQHSRYALRPGQFLYMDASGYGKLSQRVIHYLEEHYGQDVSLDVLARELEYNKSYLCVAFKKETHLTIWDCLNMIRIRRAAELIVYSDHALHRVAELCGFSSVSTFNRVFLKYVGTTPGQCRRAYPGDILLGPQNTDPNQFMYSVLARKIVTPEMVESFSDAQLDD